MRILAALTLLLVIALSPHSPASQPQLEWEYEVNPNRFLRGSTLGGWARYFGPILGSNEICAMAFGIQANEEELNYAIAVLNKEGELIWKSPLLTREPRLVYLGRECMVYRFSSEGDAPIAGFSDYFSVSLTGGSLNDPPLPLAVNRPVLSSYLEDHKTNTAFLARTSGASLAAGRRLIVQKWAPASPTPNLAPSTFGLEDGNLIISWPTAAGETYQVQRSMDLESWENIGVALTGNGTTMSYAQPSTADKVFLRVVIP